MSKRSSGHNRQRFVRRLTAEVREHKRKLHAERISLPSQLGKLVIVVSNRVSKEGGHTAQEQREAFHAEADQIAEQRKRTGSYGAVEVRRSAEAATIAQDLGDKEVSGIILIGHGAIDRFWLDVGDKLRWRNVAAQARYLKQGQIEQRMCGHFRDYDSVPLGTFAMLDQRHLVAPVGVKIDDVHPDEAAFRPVYEKPVNTVDDIRNLIKQYASMPK